MEDPPVYCFPNTIENLNQIIDERVEAKIKSMIADMKLSGLKK